MSTGYKATLDGAPQVVGDLPSAMVRLWDLGPTEPTPPKRPDLPKGKEGDPEHDLAVIDFRGALAAYETELKAYGQAKKDFADWHKTYGGPYEIVNYHSADAYDALTNDPARYCVSRSDMPNHGLPKGRKPGPYQEQQKKRWAEQERELRHAAAMDPNFGRRQAGAFA